MLYSKILVTGCGGDIGLSIGKILKSSGIVEVVIGCDITENHAGNSVFDNCNVIEKASSEKYLENLSKIVKKYGIKAIIPTSEPELRMLCSNKITNINDIPIITANYQSMEIGFDKYFTVNFLKKFDFPYPWTVPVKEGVPLSLPCIIKNRTSSGSKNVSIVNEDFVDYYRKNNKDDIWQELLLPPEEEYTCGVYGTKSGEIRTIVFKRQLQGGVTGKGETVCSSEIDDLLVNIARKLELKGSINIQLRLTSRGPIIFEINPRFSSTVAFRHKLGFRDVLWSLMENSGQNPEKYVSAKAGIKIYRIFEEVIFE